MGPWVGGPRGRFPFVGEPVSSGKKTNIAENPMENMKILAFPGRNEWIFDGYFSLPECKWLVNWLYSTYKWR